MKKIAYMLLIALMLFATACGVISDGEEPIKNELPASKLPAETQEADPIKEITPTVEDKGDKKGEADKEVPIEMTEEGALRGEYFDFAIKNRIDYLPEFSYGHPPTDSSEYLYFVFMINFANWGEDKGIMTKDYVEEIIYKYFQVEEIEHKPFPGGWDFDGEKYIAVPIGVNEDPIYVLKELETRQDKGGIIYLATLDLYYLENEMPSEEDMKIIKADIIEGDYSDLTYLYSQILEFYLESSTGNPVFLSNIYID